MLALVLAILVLKVKCFCDEGTPCPKGCEKCVDGDCVYDTTLSTCCLSTLNCADCYFCGADQFCKWSYTNCESYTAESTLQNFLGIWLPLISVFVLFGIMCLLLKCIRRPRNSNIFTSTIIKSSLKAEKNKETV